MEELNYTQKTPQNIKLSVNSVYSAPIFKETKNKKWVDYVDNDKQQFPDELIKYKNNCALHGSIIESIIRQIVGNGFTYDASSTKAPATAKFLDEINANELLNNISADYVLFGGFSEAIVWSPDYKKVNNIEHIDFSKLRSSIVDLSTGKIPGYFYTWNWDTQRPQNIVFMPSFSEQTAKENANKYEQLKKQFDLENNNLYLIEQFFKEPTTQIRYFNPYRAGSFYYPYPKYIGGINAIKTMILADQYGINSMENGMTIDYMFNFVGEYNDEQKKKETQAILKQVTNPARKKWPLITFSPDDGHKVQITKVSGTNQDRNYTTIYDNTEKEILEAHSITSPLLVGIKTEGQLGGTTELQDAETIFFKNVIRPYQLQILKVMNEVMKINKLEILDIERLTIYPVNPANNELQIKNK